MATHATYGVIHDTLTRRHDATIDVSDELQETWRKVAGRDFATFLFSRFLHLVLGSREASKPMLLKRGESRGVGTRQ